MESTEPTRIPENRVVSTKLSREEFSRLQHYCELKGETVNSAIKNLVMSEVDRPTVVEANQDTEAKGIMFDTNAFDKVLEGSIPLDLIKKSMSKGYKYFITHIQTDELSAVPDSKKEKRAKIALFLSVVSPLLIPTESFVLGYSRLGFAKLGTAGHYEKILNEGKSNVRDAIIGDTAIANKFLLVTDDNRFKSKVESIGGESITIEEFKQKLAKEVRE